MAVVGVRPMSLAVLSKDLERIRLRALVPADVWIKLGVMLMKRPERRRR